jgi:hypothetical protein
MSRSNFCANCGARLARKGWRSWLAGARCDDCALRLGRGMTKRFVILAASATAAFAFGRYLRPAPPPLIIHRAANSPLSDVPVDFNAQTNRTMRTSNSNSMQTGLTADDTAYICGARTKKGTPCRRRVHAAGERCYQHKGMAAILSLDKLTIQTK